MIGAYDHVDAFCHLLEPAFLDGWDSETGMRHGESDQHPL
jgi:hypothetical protein